MVVDDTRHDPRLRLLQTVQPIDQYFASIGRNCDTAALTMMLSFVWGRAAACKATITCLVVTNTEQHCRRKRRCTKNGNIYLNPVKHSWYQLRIPTDNKKAICQHRNRRNIEAQGPDQQVPSCALWLYVIQHSLPSCNFHVSCSLSRFNPPFTILPLLTCIDTVVACYNSCLNWPFLDSYYTSAFTLGGP